MHYELFDGSPGEVATVESNKESMRKQCVRLWPILKQLIYFYLTLIVIGNGHVTIAD